MSKNQSSQNSSRISCEKIHKSTFGRFLYPNRYPSLPSRSRVPYTQPMALQQPVSGKEIPIESGSPPKAKPVKNFVRFSSKNDEINGDLTDDKELAGHGTFGEAKFDSFIGRTKMKMSAPSDIGKTVSRHDSFHEKVSNFINRAKIKMRASSSMGANGKNVSFK
ncbi:hypothetical protein OSB04_022810 [Centaurea solstitialis]|uniref:Uncharacterized protein n=1 Tax=Centaurea solstitialis TaxID=347529 RepID=A0AA38SIP6_9ASTR|nr:hypothetical protein OSB04_022810 [Centaurea solstitialis]